MITKTSNISKSDYVVK